MQKLMSIGFYGRLGRGHGNLVKCNLHLNVESMAIAEAINLATQFHMHRLLNLNALLVNRDVDMEALNWNPVYCSHRKVSKITCHVSPKLH